MTNSNRFVTHKGQLEGMTTRDWILFDKEGKQGPRTPYLIDGKIIHHRLWDPIYKVVTELNRREELKRTQELNETLTHLDDTEDTETKTEDTETQTKELT
jgi:hypothetical protein